MKNLIKIAESVASGRGDLFSFKEYDKLTDAIFWAWDNWEEEVLSTYYTGEKPEQPTERFRKEWVENELGAVPENWEDFIESFKG